MAKSIGGADYELGADLTELRKGLADAGAAVKASGAQVEQAFSGKAAASAAKLGDTLETAGGKAKGMGGGFSFLTGAIQGAGIGAFTMAANAVAGLTDELLNAGSAQDEAANKVKVVFGAQAKDIEAFTEGSARNLGLSKTAALSALGTYGNLFSAMKLAPQASAEMSKGLVTLSADLASFNDASPEEALNALRAGLTGETEPLKRFGVNLSEARIQAKALELGLADATGELSAGAKAQASYALIMEDTAKAQGDFARTSTGQANGQRVNAAIMADAMAKISAKITPIIEKLLPGIATGFEIFGNVAGPAIDIVLGGVGALGSIVIPIFTEVGGAIRGLAEFFLGAASTIVGVAASIPGPWQDGAKELQGSLDKMKADVASWGRETVAVAASAPVAAAERMEASYPDMVKAADKTLGEPIIAAITDARAEAVRIAGETPGDIAARLRNKRAEWQDAVGQLGDDLENAMSRAAEAAKIRGELSGKNLAKGLKSADPVVRAQAQATKDLLDSRLRELESDAETFGKNTGAAYAAGLRASKGLVNDAANYVVRGAVGAFKASSPPGPESPLHLIDVWGERTMQAYADGILRAGQRVRQAAADVLGSVGPAPRLTAAVDGALAASGGRFGSGGQAFAPPTTSVRQGDISIGAINLYGVGSDVSPAAARDFSQLIGDEVATMFREQSARRGIHPVNS